MLPLFDPLLAGVLQPVDGAPPRPGQRGAAIPDRAGRTAAARVVERQRKVDQAGSPWVPTVLS